MIWSWHVALLTCEHKGETLQQDSKPRALFATVEANKPTSIMRTRLCHGLSSGAFCFRNSKSISSPVVLPNGKSWELPHLTREAGGRTRESHCCLLLIGLPCALPKGRSLKTPNPASAVSGHSLVQLEQRTTLSPYGSGAGSVQGQGNS